MMLIDFLLKRQFLNLRTVTSHLLNSQRKASESRQEIIDHAISLLEGLYISEWSQICRSDPSALRNSELRSMFIQERAGQLVNRVFFKINAEGKLKATQKRESNPVEIGDGILLVDQARFNERLKDESETGQLRKLAGIASPKPLLVPTQGIIDSVAKLGMQHPNFKNVTDNIVAILTIQKKKGRPIKLSNMLFHGLPGIGKTRYLNRLAQALGIDVLFLPLAGYSDTIAITGNSRGWASAAPGKIARFVASSRYANPLIIMDEVDKTGGANHAMVSDILLSLLEPEQSRIFLDAYLDVPIDLSRVNFVATANDPDKISSPLRSRFSSIPVGMVDEADMNIVITQVIEDICEENSFDFEEVVTEINCNSAGLSSLSVREIRDTLKHQIYQSLMHQ